MEPFSFDEVCRSTGKEADDFLHALKAKLLDGKGLKVFPPVVQKANSSSNNDDNNNNDGNSLAQVAALPGQGFSGEVVACDGVGDQLEQPAYDQVGWITVGPMAMSQAPESVLLDVSAASTWSLPPETSMVDLSHSRDLRMDDAWSSEYCDNNGWSGGGNARWDHI